MNYLLTAGGFLLGYVFGSIPCGLWLVQAFHGIDIRKYGSGNIGTTNVFRTVGPKTAEKMLDNFEKLIVRTRFLVLTCNMDVSAAETAYQAIRNLEH